jgi:hypothetical protein
MLESRYYDTSSAAWHSLHITQNEWRGNRVSFTSTTASDNDTCLGGDVLGHELWLVEIDSLFVLAGFSVPLFK